QKSTGTKPARKRHKAQHPLFYSNKFDSGRGINRRNVGCSSPLRNFSRCCSTCSLQLASFSEGILTYVLLNDTIPFLPRSLYFAFEYVGLIDQHCHLLFT